MGYYPRFSLRLLILLMGFACAYLGARQYRDRQVMTLCAELKSSGYSFDIPDELPDLFWQRKPHVGTIVDAGPFTGLEYTATLSGRKVASGLVLHSNEARRLIQLGVVDVRD